MKSQSRISFIKISILTLIFSLLFSIIYNSIPVNAAVEVLTEGDAADDNSYAYSGTKWYATYATNCGYQGQGVLVYLLEYNGGGAVAGTTPKAFYCDDEIFNYELRAQDKYNRYPMVTKWEDPLPDWAGYVNRDNGGIIHTKNSSNVELIKEYLCIKILNGAGKESTKGIRMVYDLWESECPGVTDRFVDEQIILVIEPIVSNQFAQYMKSDILTSLTPDMKLEELIKVLRDFQLFVGLQSYTKLSSDLNNYLTDTIAKWENMLNSGAIKYMSGSTVEEQIKLIINDLDQLVTSSNVYWPLGDPIAGTSKEVYKYYNELTADQTVIGDTSEDKWKKTPAGSNYFKQAANNCSVLNTSSRVCKFANFNLYDRSFSITNTTSLDKIEKYSIGMLAMLAWHNDDPQSTWDQPNPDPHKAPDESDGTCTIIKSYRTKDTILNQLTDDGTYTRYNVASSIDIEDEPEYKLVEWRVSNAADPYIKSTEWESKVPGEVVDSGKNPYLVTLPEDHTILYVLLERVIGDPVDTDANYILSQSSITRHIDLNTPDSVVVDGDTLDLIKDNHFGYSIPAHTKTSCSGHTYTTKCNGTHKCTDIWYCTTSGMSTSPNNRIVCGGPGAGLCVGHSCNQDAKHPYCAKPCDDDGCQSHSETCTWGEWKDTSLSISLTNTLCKNFGDIVATKDNTYLISKETPKTSWTYNFTRDDYTMDKRTWTFTGINYEGLIHRGATKIVVADWKTYNEAKKYLDSLSSSCFTVANTIPADRGSRKSSDYRLLFTIKLTDSSTDTSTSRGSISEAPNSKETCSESTSLVYHGNDFSVSPSVQVLVYLGTASAASMDTSIPGDINTSHSGNYTYGKSVKSGTITNFRPYVQMKYDTISADDLTAYVLGEHDRSLSLNSYAEVSWKASTKPNITLDSLQWSIHNEAKSHVKNTVLPGGATLSLSIKSADRQKVTVRTYVPILAGAGKLQIENAGGTANLATVESAKNAHNDLVNSVIGNIENLYLQQYADTKDYGSDISVDRSTSKDVFNNGGKVGNGVSFKGSNNITVGGSSDKKYYFGFNIDDTEETRNGDLDAQIADSMTTYYTFWCDPAGNIRMAYDNKIIVADLPVNPYYGGDSTIICKRDYNSNTCSWVTSNANYYIAKDINDKTGIVNKLVLGLEKGGGMDISATGWVQDGRWYNEAFDGITYCAHASIIEVGFMEPTERVTVIDPKLCPENKGKSDFFSKYYSTQIKLEDNVRDANGNLKSNEFIGQFTEPISNTTIDLKLPNMDELLWSREIYIPNVNTQDLN